MASPTPARSPKSASSPRKSASSPRDERQREKEVARARLARLVAECPAIGTQIEAAVGEVNGDVGRPESFTALHEFLEAQTYRLSYWRTASHEINYRRFFDVNELAGLRVEDPEVFAATHALLGELLASNRVQAVRIDHPDGLFDPACYFEMLQQLGGGDLYVVAEKILSSHETLPERWPIAGTTGYDYLNELNRLFVNADEAKRMRRTYARLTGQTDSFDEVRYECKRLIMTTAMASELNVLAHALSRIAEGNRRSRDFTLDSLRDTLSEVIACFPVYRTYVDEHGWTLGDRAVVDQAIVRARRRNPAMEASLFDFFREVVMPRAPENGAGGAPVPPTPESRPSDRRTGYPPADAGEAGARQHFAMKFQQLTGPVQAKGLEDTAFFRYNLLLSLGEVGGDVERYGGRVEDFHASNAARLRQRPFEMITTATHDTKLGEDTRARINVLSEIPDEWSREVARWMRMNRTHRTIVDGEPAPDRNDEYRFYQALVGVWPLEISNPDLPAAGEGVKGPLDLGDLVERLRAYMLKAVKEAKRHTSWLTPNEEYERAVTSFVDRVLTGPGRAKFLSVFAPFARRVARIGMINGLAQVTLKIGSPGIPDFYQGAELWDLSLVDPDNRRPVDFAHRQCLLASVDQLLQHAGRRARTGSRRARHTLAGRPNQDAAHGRRPAAPARLAERIPVRPLPSARDGRDHSRRARGVRAPVGRSRRTLRGATPDGAALRRHRPGSAASARGRGLEDVTNHPAAGAPWPDVPPPRHGRRDPLDWRFWRSVDFRRPGLRHSSSRHPDVGGYVTGGLENATRSRVMRTHVEQTR